MNSNRQFNGTSQNNAEGSSAMPDVEDIGQQAAITEHRSNSNTEEVRRSDETGIKHSAGDMPTQDPVPNDSTFVNADSTGVTTSTSDNESMFQLDITL